MRRAALILALTVFTSAIVLTGRPDAGAVTPKQRKCDQQVGTISGALKGITDPVGQSLNCPNPAVGTAKNTVCPNGDNPEPPVAVKPSDGLTGFIDSGPPTPAKPKDVSVYRVFGTDPPWHTYDMGCAGTVTDPGASVDTTLGNWLFSAAKVMVSFSISAHRVVSPPSFLDVFDPVIASASGLLRDAVWIPFAGLVVLGVGVWLLWTSRRGQTAMAVTVVAWTLLVSGAAAGLMAYPVWASHKITAGVSTVITTVTGGVEPLDPADPSGARAELFTDRVVDQAWQRGEFGSATSDAAVKYRDALRVCQAFTYADAGAKDQGGIAARKAASCTAVAARLKTEDAAAYCHFQGKCGGRVAAGVIALVTAGATLPLLIVADVMVAFAAFVVKFLVLFAPVIALMALPYVWRHRGMEAVGFGVLAARNAVVLAVGGAVDMLLVAHTLGPGVDMAGWLRILACLLFEVVFLVVLRPFMRFNLGRIPGADRVKRLGRRAKKGGRKAGKEARKRASKGAGRVRKWAEAGNQPKSQPKNETSGRSVAVEEPRPEDVAPDKAAASYPADDDAATMHETALGDEYSGVPPDVAERYRAQGKAGEEAQKAARAEGVRWEQGREVADDGTEVHRVFDPVTGETVSKPRVRARGVADQTQDVGPDAAAGGGESDA